MAYQFRNKIFTLAEAVQWRLGLRQEKRKLVLTNGCFDLLHRGHAEYLIEARRSADALLILLNSDASIKRLKGPERPICAEPDRAFLLSCLEFVDAVVVFDADRCDREIVAIQPDVYVKGGDYTVEKLDPGERSAIQNCGAEIRFIPFVPGFSTTSLIEKNRKRN